MRQAPCRAAAQALDERRPIGGIGNAVVAESARITHHRLKKVDLLRGKARRDRGEGRFDGQADAHRPYLTEPDEGAQLLASNPRRLPTARLCCPPAASAEGGDRE